MTHTATKYDQIEFDELYASITPDGGVGHGTLFHLAKQNGWTDPIAAANATKDAKNILNGKLFAQVNKGRLLFIYKQVTCCSSLQRVGCVQATLK